MRKNQIQHAPCARAQSFIAAAAATDDGDDDDAKKQ